MQSSGDFFESDYFMVCKLALMLLSVFHGVHR
jgi:hypothetical protein